MNHIVELPGLDGAHLHGWLGAFGVLKAHQIVAENGLLGEQPAPIRLSWDATIPVFHSDLDHDSLVNVLAAAARIIHDDNQTWVAESYRNDDWKSDGHIKAALTFRQIIDPETARQVSRRNACAGIGSPEPWVVPDTDTGNKKIVNPAKAVRSTSPRWAHNPLKSKNPSSAVAAMISAAADLTQAHHAAWDAVTHPDRRGPHTAPNDWSAATRTGRTSKTDMPPDAVWATEIITSISRHSYGYRTAGKHNASGVGFKGVAPDLVFLAALGVLAIPARGGHQPGSNEAGDRALVRTVRWCQPLTMRAATMLAWHRDLNDMDAATHICGGHVHPVAWFELVPGEGPTPTSTPEMSNR